jgi:hypothetical protein
MTDTSGEFPRSWFAAARLADGRRDCSLNYFGVDASQPLSVWRKKGWIHPNDPRGWFQWYCPLLHGPPPARRGSSPDQAMDRRLPACVEWTSPQRIRPRVRKFLCRRGHGAASRLA